MKMPRNAYIFTLVKVVSVFGLCFFIYRTASEANVEFKSSPEQRMRHARGVDPAPSSSAQYRLIKAREMVKPGSKRFLQYKLRQDDLLHDATMPNDSECQRFRKEWNGSWQVAKNVYDAHITDRHAVTLVTHLSPTRLMAFGLSLRHWKGPVSVSIYTKRDELNDVLTELWNILASKRQNLFVHIILQVDHFYYPGNMLRNIAAEAVETEFSFLNDGDFLPSVKAEEKLNKYARTTLKQRQIFVLPAFAFLENHPAHDFSVLYDKRKLIEIMKSSKPSVETFADYVYLQGHRRTNYKKWYESYKPYQISYEPDFEPYVLMFTSDVMHYPELFLGWFFDKASQFMLLALNRYSFHVLPDVYVIHYYHKRSHSMLQYRHCSFHLYVDWCRRLRDEYLPGEELSSENH